MHKVEAGDLPLSVLMEAPLGLIALDFTGKILICNNKALLILGISQLQDTLINKPLTNLIQDLPELIEWVKTLNLQQPLAQKKVIRANANTRILITSQPFIHGLILTLQDTTEPDNQSHLLEATSLQLEAALKKSKFYAEFDHLTQLPNRDYFIRQAVISIKSLSSSQSASLIFVDLKDFNQINETLGHQAGDELLRYISQRLNTFCKANNNLHARMGGDKFCILHIDQAEYGMKAISTNYVEKLQECFSLPAPISGFTATVAISIGLSNYPRDALNFSDLFKCADLACQKSKKQGGLITYDNSLDTTLGRYRLKLAHDAKSALLNNEFIIYLQPKLNIRSKQITSCEALIRWLHPDYGLIMPHDFIPMIEKSPLIHDLLFHVLEKSIKEIMALNNSIQISINVSPRNLFTPDLITRVSHLLNNYQANPKNLCFELTETALMNTGTATKTMLFELQKLGMTLSLDDYGTGFSSLSHIQSLPIDQIKIDRSFVYNMHTSEKDRIIVNSTIQLARNLGLEVVAEGVELQTHIQMLQKMGCDIAQGYFISRPCPASEARVFINDYNE